MASVVILLGPTGSGKSSQSKFLSSKHKYVRIASGDLLRATATPDIESRMREGRLALSQDVERVVGQAIDDVPEGKNIILDGFPRELEQAKWLDDRLAVLGRQLDKVLVLQVQKKLCLERLNLRRRGDDERANIEHRLRDYESVTSDVLEYYSQQGKVAEIDGSGSQEEVAKLIEVYL